MKPRFPKNEFTDNWRAKNYSVQAAGRLGGQARARNLSKERLHDIAMEGVKARLEKMGDKYTFVEGKWKKISK